MSLTFHDGTNPLYRNYSTNRAWNDAGLLRLNPGRSYDKLLIDTYNQEARIKAMFGGSSVKNCRPGGPGASKLSEYVDSAGRDVIVIKGLHQWIEKVGTWSAKWGSNYQLHLSFGLDGQLWHLNATYYADSEKIVLSHECSAGERVSAVDHEGFGKQKRK